MNKLIIICVLLFWSSATKISAQEKTEKGVEIYWGIGKIKRQDLSFTSQIHENSSLKNFELRFYRSARFEHIADVKFASYNTTIGNQFRYISRYNGEQYKLPSVFNLIDLNYFIGKKILSEQKLHLTVGGKSRNKFYFTEYDFGPASSAGYYFSIGTDAWFNAKYDLNERHHFNGNLGIPLFAYVSRPPYLTQDDEYFRALYSHNDLKLNIENLKRGEFMSWGKSQSFDFDLSYYYSVSEKIDIGTRYLLSVNLGRLPQKLTQVENSICLSVNLKF